MEASEVCHMVYISQVEFLSAAIPQHLFSDSLFLKRGEEVAQEEDAKNTIDRMENRLIELPTCPVCLERMDASATGLLTILCNHTFHCDCLRKWGDSSCPVCRYSSKALQESDPDLTPNACEKCNAQDNLWICLLCGRVGCGRYNSAHAYEHFQETSHLFSLELDTQRVWDYTGDGYVHRLIQNNADGKIVELSAPSRGGGHQKDSKADGSDGSDRANQKKLEHISLEYTYLLTSQLESQRLFYESQLGKFQDALTTQLDELSLKVAQLESERDNAETEYASLYSRMPVLEKERESLQRRIDRQNERINQLSKDLAEEKALNKGLMAHRQREDELELEVRKGKEQVAELNEQVRDLMAFLDMQRQVQENPELQQSSVSVVPDNSSNNNNNNSKKSSPSRRRGKR
ncbi:MAG: hypothetical protein SGCHY_001996 [Lobulomycetales sp.]